MSPTPDLQDVIHDVVLAVLALATGYHLVRLGRGPVRAVDAAHALMGAVMLLMLAGRLGHAADLGLAVVFVAVGIAGVFARARVELAIGSAAMIVMLVATPLTAAVAAAASSGKAFTAGTGTGAGVMPGMAGMGHSLRMTSSAASSPGSSAGLITLILVVVLVPALMVVATGAVLRSRTCTTEPPGNGASPAAVACRVGLNLASAYMLILMV